MDATSRSLHINVLHKIKGNVPSFLCIIENYIIKLYEKMQT